MNEQNLSSDNLATSKRKLAEAADTPSTAVETEDALELHAMSPKERRRYKRQQEKEKLAELSFWRKVQYILMYYTWKFLAVVGAIALILLVAQRVYIATRPVALHIVLANDTGSEDITETITSMYKSYYEVRDDARFYVDTNCFIDPGETLTSLNTSYYTKMMSALTHNSTHIVICDSPVIDYYAVDGYFLELKHGLPEDIWEQVSDRLYECDGPVEDSDYYAIDISGMEFTKEAGIQLEQPYLCIPTCLDDEKREIAFNFIRMILDMEEKAPAE